MNKKMLGTLIALSLTASMVSAQEADNRIVPLTKSYGETVQKAQLSLAKTQVAQQDAVAEPLALPDAIHYATHHNHDVKVALANYEAAKSSVGVAAAAKNPTFTYGYSAGRAETVSALGANIGNSYSNSLSATLPLYTGGKAEGAIASARYARDIAGANAERAVQTIRLEAAKAYFTVLQTENKADVAAMQVADLAAHKKNVDAQFNVGVVAKSDVLATDVQVATAETAKIQADNAVDVAKAAFKAGRQL